jgi:Xaa-Pro aminopeptidase
MIREKIGQARAVLGELGIDLWLIFVRESATLPDPALPIVVGTNVTWQSAFLIPRVGETRAIVGSLDRPNMVSQGVFDQVEGYVEGVRAPLRAAIAAIDPQRVAINFSRDVDIADGLTHGMYLNLVDYLTGTPYAERFESSAPILARLRGRKTPAEVERMRGAVDAALAIFAAVAGFIRPGRSEKEIATFMKERVAAAGLELAWDPDHCPAVFTGPDTAGAHAGPTDRRVEPGHVLNIDFGVRKDGYCSDLQRTFYIRREGETTAPPEVQRGFQVIVDAITKGAEVLRPGVPGWQVDAAARGHITANGYPEYQHALGHQIGRVAHDGSGLLSPRWERYGGRSHEPVEAGQVYTLEPRLPIEGYGIATVEEMVLVEPDGVEWLSGRQTELLLIPPPA